MHKELIGAVALLMTIPPVAGFAADLPDELIDDATIVQVRPPAPVLDPIMIGLRGAPVATRDLPFELGVTLTATWGDVLPATVRLDVGDGVAVLGPQELVVELLRDQPQSVSFVLRVLDPGLHRLQLHASGVLASGPDTTIAAAREAYLDVPDTGAGTFTVDLPPLPDTTYVYATEQVDPALVVPVTPSPDVRGTLPPSVGLPEPPARDPGTDVPDSGGPGIGPDLAFSHSTFQVKVCWAYENEASNGFFPQHNVAIQVWDSDEGFNDDELVDFETSSTGFDGCYTSPDIAREEPDCCDRGNQDVYLVIRLCNDAVCAVDADEDVYEFGTGEDTVGSEDLMDFGTLTAADDPLQFGLRAYQYVNNAALYAIFNANAPGVGASGPQIRVWAPSQDGFCSSNPLFFRLESDTVNICGPADERPDDAAHEYGHGVMDKMYGDSFWPSSNPAHNFCQDNLERAAAWTEGYADWFAVRATFEEGGIPSADGNVAYDRPWDGSSFSINFETTDCGFGGDDDEINVGTAMWDLRDGANDGIDASSDAGTFIHGVIGNCNDNNYRDYFDAGCGWTSHGGSACNFLRTAFQNNVDFDDTAPTASMTSQGAFQWVNGFETLTATVADGDGFGCPLSAEFRVSDNSSCSDTDTLAGTDTTSPYSFAFDTSSIADNADVWTCVQGSDSMETTPWDASASAIGVDNTDPNVGISADGAFQNGWFREIPTISIGCTDNLSGVASRQYSVDFGPLQAYVSPFTIVGEGVHLLIVQCTDNAGNVDSDAELIRIDTLDPATLVFLAGTSGENGWYIGDVTVTMSCTDPVPGSGCFNTQVVHTDPLGGGGIFSYASPFVLTGDGTHNVGYHSVDVAGNVEPTAAFDVFIDTVGPTGSIVTATTGGFAYTQAELVGGVFTNAATLDVQYAAADATSGLQLVSIAGADSDAYTGELAGGGTLTVPLPAGISTWTLTVEDMAGHVTDVATFSVVSVPAGPTDPRGAGFWKNAVKSAAYTDPQIDTFLGYGNTASHSFGVPDDRYADATLATYLTYLSPSPPPSPDDKARKELLASWLNLVSGRESAGQAVDVGGVVGWPLVVQNTSGSSATTALNVVREAERRLNEAPTDALLNTIQGLLAALNGGTLNT